MSIEIDLGDKTRSESDGARPVTPSAQLSDLAPEGGYARLAHTTQYIERETPPTAASTSAESNI